MLSSSLELIFTAFMLLMPVYAVITGKFTRYYVVCMVGANPYATAGSLLICLLLKLKVILRKRTNKLLLITFALWGGYGLVLGIYRISIVFLSEYIQLLIAIMLAVFIYNTNNTEKESGYFVKSLIFAGTIVSLFKIILVAIHLNIDTKAYITFTSSNYASFFILISMIILPLHYCKKNSIKYSFLVLGYIAIYLNESRAMMLASIFFITKYLITSKNRLFRYISIIAVSGGVFYILSSFNIAETYSSDSLFSVMNFNNNFSNLERIRLLLYSYDLFIHNVFGHGVGSSYALFVGNPYTVLQTYPHPHNTLAFMAVELGFIGILIYILFFYSMFVTVVKSNNIERNMMFDICLGLFAFSLVDALFYNGLLMLLCFMMYGFVMSSCKLQKNA